mmetsp:Transcript_4574/g.10739  ORF Transcript_4574/g.10739 Transcript_4574/m.10739 type:complete len:259 (+) Transcript_4574:551-1327(+)
MVESSKNSVDALADTTKEMKGNHQTLPDVDKLIQELALRPIELDIVRQLCVLGNTTIQNHKGLQLLDIMSIFSHRSVFSIDGAIFCIDLECDLPHIMKRSWSLEPILQQLLQQRTVVFEQRAGIRIPTTPTQRSRKIIPCSQWHHADVHSLRVDVVKFSFLNHPHDRAIASTDKNTNHVTCGQGVPHNMKALLVASNSFQQTENMQSSTSCRQRDRNAEGLWYFEKLRPNLATRQRVHEKEHMFNIGIVTASRCHAPL